MDWLSFDTHPEFVAAFRFLFWSMFIGVTGVAVNYARLSKHRAWAPKVIPIGVAMIFGSMAVHQFYYWLVHRARAHDHEMLLTALEDIRHITSVLLIVMCIGGLLYIGHYMREMFGSYWVTVSAGIMIALWCVGYLDARWV